MAAGEKLTLKRERGSNIIFPIILRLLKILSKGEGNGKFWEENHDLKKLGVGKDMKL